MVFDQRNTRKEKNGAKNLSTEKLFGIICCWDMKTSMSRLSRLSRTKFRLRNDPIEHN